MRARSTSRFAWQRVLLTEVSAVDVELPELPFALETESVVRYSVGDLVWARQEISKALRGLVGT